MLDLICVGEMLIDFLPGPEEGSFLRKPGGAPANVAVAAARNGLNTGFCGRVGDDEFGRFLLRTLEQHQVRSLCPEPVREAVTTLAFVSLTKEGERSFTFARKPGADMFLTCRDVDAAGVTEACIVHAGSCSLSKGPAADATRYALRMAHEAGRLVSFDVNYRDLMWDGDRKACIAAVREILPYVDLLKISQEEQDMLGLPAQQAAAEYGITALVETLGAQGARCHFDGSSIFAAGYPAACVDATGAGDAFWGGFLSCLRHAGVACTADFGREFILQALQYGNVAGSLCVRKKGAMESLPTAAEVRALLSHTC